MSADTEPVAEPHRIPSMPPPAQAPASEPDALAGTKAVSGLAPAASLRLAATRPPNLAPIADASPAATIVELADDPPMHAMSAPQPIPAPRAIPAAQSPVQPSPGSSTPLGSPLNTSHLRSRSPHSPSSPGFTPSSASSSRPRGRPTSQLVGSIGAAINSKPRSNSSLTSNRPAPPSPAGSRPQSQVLDISPRELFVAAGAASGAPALARSSPSPVGRERAASTSSAVSQGRRVRPRSTLGTSVLSASEGPNSDPTTPYTTPSAVFARRGGSFDARAGGFDLSAAVEEVKDELGDESRPSRQASPPLSTSDTAAPASHASPAAPASPLTGSLAHLAASLVRRVIVRDFAFPEDDERFLGLGAQRPRSNWGEGEPEPEPAPVRSMFSGGWGFLRREDDDPGRVEDMGVEQDAADYWSEADEFDDYYLADEEPDGLYRAAFAFEPEGVNEMAVEVGDLLDVRGRGGGGDGWVVATRLDTGAEGLVPEGYLERTQEEEYPAEWAVVRDVRAKLAAACAESLETRELSASPESTDDEERLRHVLEMNAGH
ncbi:hypothetical protein CC85DRAFT_283104 [Cutaneotrichosporon oleaginosum]|uniref:SH3 domain-containing protein n=1 Tax=Cutaneotrichosporon oleaginosum TaxID=879819 RepID=A0A0J0XUN5_9TREE|nr:uncharacterized protein CC85DRAFT_283104 [Cutaneotrichosporon oleaginosum]KLT44811.1 hypothetical protein CC85DRAFT_283104 [Cutaneotrichosporon oleaginosum]TXT11950.1 hypothetical protein COLE_02360 [Cutaneotrichosporon oleaginosum]